MITKLLTRVLKVKDDAVEAYKDNPQSKHVLSLITWALGELKKLDSRKSTDVQQTCDTAFAGAVAEMLKEVKGKAHLSLWEDKLWHAKVARGKSLTSLSSLLSAAGGVGPVKVEWQLPVNMDLLWLDRAWFTRRFNSSQYVISDPENCCGPRCLRSSSKY